MNLIVYPLYLINDNIEHYQSHKEIIELNISHISKFFAPENIKIIGKRVKNWSEMINDLMENIQLLLNKKNNVLLCEADNFIIEDFKELFELNKFTLFALCNNGSKLDKTLPGGVYLNAGLAYFPFTNFKNYFNFPKLDATNSSEASLIYEKQINNMFYSQFSSHVEGLDYIKLNSGFSEYNWRGLLCVDIDKRFKYKSLPTAKKIKSIHFLNLSEYIHKNEGFKPFWYKIYVDKLVNGENKKKVIISILLHYKKYVLLNNYKKAKLFKYLLKVVLN